MVKTLLEEQRLLKEKLEIQEIKMRDNGSGNDAGTGFLQRNKKEITKRASERTRSQQPPKKVVQSADSKTIHARKQKEQHAIEQAKLDAIEAKI